MKAAVRIYTLKAETPDGPLVVAQIEVDCPMCGALRYVIPGHHLRMLRDVLIDVIDQAPEAAGPEATAHLRAADRLTFPLDGPATKES